MLTFARIPLEGVEDDLQMCRVIEEVGVADVDEKGAGIVLLDIAGIGLLYGEEVIIGDALFVRAVPLADIGLQFADRSVEVDQDIRLYDLGLEDIEEILIEPELLVGKIDLCEQEAFGEEVVGDGDGLEKVG